MTALSQYISLYDDARTLLEATSPEPLNRRRATALQRLQQADLRPLRLEEYKYTDLEALLAPDYGMNLQHVSLGNKGQKRTSACSIADMGTLTLHFDNDLLQADDALPQQLPAGMFVGTIKEAFRAMPDLVLQHYGALSDHTADPTAALNTLFAQDGLCIRVPKDCTDAPALQLIMRGGAPVRLMMHRRVLIVLEENASLSLLVCDETGAQVPSVSTEVVEIFQAEGSRLQLFSLEETQRLHTRLATTLLRQDAHSQAETYHITLSNGTSRHTTLQRFAAPDASLTSLGAALLGTGQHLDHNLLCHHAADQCRSHMLYKYVVDANATGAFAGRVLVDEGTRGNRSSQTNQNLCADATARAYSQPMLEIYADDVECSHGSTVGRLDDNALFYMQQRGIPEPEARMLLQHAFVAEVIEQIPLDALRQRLLLLADLRLRGRLEKCQSCRVADQCHEAANP